MARHDGSSQFSPPPNGVISREPRWTSALIEGLAQLAGPLSPEVRNQVRCAAWPILRTALTAMVRQHMNQLGPLPAEAVEDIAAEKSLRLMLRCEAGRWNPRGWSGQQLGSFLARVARNGIIDHLRLDGPRRVASSEDGGVSAPLAHPALSSNPATLMEAAEFAAFSPTLVYWISPAHPAYR